MKRSTFRKYQTPLILIVVAGLGYVGWRSTHKPPKPMPPVTVAVTKGELVVMVSESGTIQPLSKVDVKSKVAGRIISEPIFEGETVKAGQLIALVDRTLIDPQIARQQAVVNQSQATLEQAQTQYVLQVKQTTDAIEQAKASLHAAQTHLATVAAGARDQEIAQQQEAVARAKIALDDSNRTLTRKKSLVSRGFVPQSDVDTAQVNVDTAQSNLSSANQQLSLTLAGPRPVDVTDAQSQVYVARAALNAAYTNAMNNNLRRLDITQQEAALSQSRNDLVQLQVQLNDTRIIAPAAGTVLKIYKQPSEIIQSATTGFSDSESIVATLGDQLMVQADINEIDIARVQLHQHVNIHVDALGDQTFTGEVIGISPSSDGSFSTSSSASTSTVAKYTVKIAITHSGQDLRTGMNADVDIITARHKNAILVPLEAIPFTGTKGSVTVLDAGVKKTTPVVLGLRNDTDAEVLSGLALGDNVVVPPVSSEDRRTIDIGGDN